MLKDLSTAAVAAVVAVGCLGGCVDAKKRFDEFDDRVPPIDASLVDRPPLDIADIDGTWYLAIKALGNNLHLFVTWDITINGDTASLDGTYQPLSISRQEGVDPPRLPVGAALTSTDDSVDGTATFMAKVLGTFDGAANPVSTSNLGSAVTLVGTIKSGNLVCGTLTGHVCLGDDANPDGTCTGGASVVPVSPATFAAVRAPAVNMLPPLEQLLDHCPDPQAIDAGVDAMIDAP